MLFSFVASATFFVIPVLDSGTWVVRMKCAQMIMFLLPGAVACGGMTNKSLVEYFYNFCKQKLSFLRKAGMTKWYGKTLCGGVISFFVLKKICKFCQNNL